MRKILIAENSGYCFGVKRAMNIAWEEISKIDDSSDEKRYKIYSLGPLIHNKQAVSKYEEKGLVTIDRIEDIDDDYKDIRMIIRSHGVGKSVYDDSKLKGINLVDTTCPFVRKIHYLVKKSYVEGEQVVVIGDSKHPEVIGINGWCEDSAIIIKSLDEAKNISFEPNKKYTIVSQTTMNEKVFEEIINYIKCLGINFVVENTICSATKIRQTAARELSKSVDVMIVIGGRHSSNTQKLVDICTNMVNTYAVETVEDLMGIYLGSDITIGITAGASTPDWIINEIVDYLSD